MLRHITFSKWGGVYVWAVILLSLGILSLTIYRQASAIEQQRTLIHAMQSNPACMGVQPVKAPEPLPYTYRAIMGMVPNPPTKGI